MGRLSAGQIQYLIDTGYDFRLESGRYVHKPLIEPVSDERFNFIESSVYDLGLCEVCEPDDRRASLILASLKTSDSWEEMTATGLIPFIGTDNRILPEGKRTEKIRLKNGTWGWYLRPWKSYLLESRETLNIPPDISAPLECRSSVFRGFGHVTISEAGPNYQGKIVGLLFVTYPYGMILQQGCRWAWAKFETFDDISQTDAYQGIYGTHGHKVTTQGKTARAY